MPLRDRRMPNCSLMPESARRNVVQQRASVPPGKARLRRAHAVPRRGIRVDRLAQKSSRSRRATAAARRRPPDTKRLLFIDLQPSPATGVPCPCPGCRGRSRPCWMLPANRAASGIFSGEQPNRSRNGNTWATEYGSSACARRPGTTSTAGSPQRTPVATVADAPTVRSPIQSHHSDRPASRVGRVVRSERDPVRAPGAASCGRLASRRT